MNLAPTLGANQLIEQLNDHPIMVLIRTGNAGSHGLEGGKICANDGLEVRHDNAKDTPGSKHATTFCQQRPDINQRVVRVEVEVLDEATTFMDAQQMRETIVSLVENAPF